MNIEVVNGKPVAEAIKQLTAQFAKAPAAQKAVASDTMDKIKKQLTDSGIVLTLSDDGKTLTPDDQPAGGTKIVLTKDESK